MRLLPKKLHSYLNLSRKDRGLLLKAWILLLGIDWSLRLVPFHYLRGWLFNPAPVSVTAKTDPKDAIERTSGAVNRAARNHIYPMTCLRRALALKHLLIGSGIWTELRFGVQRENGGLSAHAWLEYEGQPINEPQMVEKGFTTLVAQEFA